MASSPHSNSEDRTRRICATAGIPMIAIDRYGDSLLLVWNQQCIRTYAFHRQMQTQLCTLSRCNLSGVSSREDLELAAGGRRIGREIGRKGGVRRKRRGSSIRGISRQSRRKARLCFAVAASNSRAKDSIIEVSSWASRFGKYATPRLGQYCSVRATA